MDANAPNKIELLEDVLTQDIKSHLDDELDENNEVVVGDEKDEDVGHENDEDMGDENDGDKVDEIYGDEDGTPDAILAQCFELLSVDNHFQLVSMLMRYKQQKDGQTEAIEISFELKRQRQEYRKQEKK